MNIGIVCEGPTDYPAIEHFLGDALNKNGITANFRALFPQMDNTRPDGGWGNVLNWLRNNPPESRIPEYFGAGLFGGKLKTPPLDAIIIHLDSDILPDNSFRSYVKNKYDFDVQETDEPCKKAQQISKIITLSAQLANMNEVDKNKHIPVPAIDSTEAWCVAAYRRVDNNYEELSGTQLINAFMSALEESEGRPIAANYSNINKVKNRRNNFCQKYAANSSHVIRGCEQFSITLNKLLDLS